MIEAIWDDLRYFANGKPIYHGRTGEALSLREWSAAFADFDARTVARTRFGDVEVLTLWHGIDSDPTAEGPPLIFGSIVRVNGEIVVEVESCTEAGAAGVHEELVARARLLPQGTPPPSIPQQGPPT